VLWESDKLRIVRVAEPDYPGFCRVIWQAHIREMTDLSTVDRQNLMETVFAVEAVVRELCRPDKINLASFGNVVPHVHWHIIPRWQDDRHFPQPVWGTAQRSSPIHRPNADDAAFTAALTARLGPTAAAAHPTPKGDSPA
jgi:diadenosine tetraphosphate (Ap4A) HIT family hydrolase